MKITTYRELKDNDKNRMLIMGLKSFYWGMTPAWMDYYIKHDEFVDDGPIGMCGLINGKLAGFVGMMYISTKTKSGEIEKVGGIYGIMTLPGYAGRGIARKLLEAAEDYFKNEGFRFSFLTTASFLTAYHWYVEVGYSDIPMVEKYPYLYKVFKKPNEKPVKKTPKEHKIDYKKMLEIFNWYAEDKTGFTYRTPMLLKSREIDGVFSKPISILTKNGYALLSSANRSIVIKEILAKSQKAYSELIKMASERAQYGLAAQHPYDPIAVKALVKAGLQIDRGNYIKAMCKPLGKDSFNDAYGKKFLISKVDWF